MQRHCIWILTNRMKWAPGHQWPIFFRNIDPHWIGPPLNFSGFLADLGLPSWHNIPEDVSSVAYFWSILIFFSHLLMCYSKFQTWTNILCKGYHVITISAWTSCLHNGHGSNFLLIICHERIMQCCQWWLSCYLSDVHGSFYVFIFHLRQLNWYIYGQF